MGGILGNWWFAGGDSWGLVLRWERKCDSDGTVLPRADFSQKHNARTI